MNSDELISKYIELIKSGMEKDKAIQELMSYSEIIEEYDKSDIEFILVAEIDDEKKAKLDDDFIL